MKRSFKRMLLVCTVFMMLCGCAITVSAADNSQFAGKVVCVLNRTAVVTKNGDLYVWGNNNHGQVGDGTTETRYRPVKILTNVESVYLKEYHTAALTKNGDLYMWGANFYGRLGTGNGWYDEHYPVKVMSNVVSFTMGNDFNMAVTRGRDLYTWGQNMCGQIGNGTTNDQYQPVKVMSNVASYYMADDYDHPFCAGITKGGDLYLWGDNNDNQIGSGPELLQLRPTKILSSVASAAIYSDYNGAYSAAVKKDGSLYLWGYNYYGQVGNGTDGMRDVPSPVKVLSNVTKVSLKEHYTIALQKDGSLYTWGKNYEGQLGNGTSDESNVPVKILSGVASFEQEKKHCAALTKNGDLYLWGENGSGQIGNGEEWYVDTDSPVKVLSNVADVSLNLSASAAITKSGTLYAWGSNSVGDLGLGEDSRGYDVPSKVLGDVAYFRLSDTNHNAAVTEDGNLYLWGCNGYGQVGNNTRVDQLVPVKIMDKVYNAQSNSSIADTSVERIYGENRYQTSYKIAGKLKAQQNIWKFDTVIIADGRNFPDALAGSYLAKVKNAPILMANEKNKESLQKYVKENLKNGGLIYVLGGENAVPQSILNGLDGYRVKRLSGNNRYATNIMILEEAGVTDEDILVCTGNGFADSLSASATGKPILLVKNKNFTEEQIQFIEEHRRNDYYIIGGEGAVSAKQMAEINNYVYGYVERIAGNNRYETSVKVAESFFAWPESAIIAYGKNFPDGLCGGPLAMSFDAPLILADTKATELAEEYLDENYISAGKVLGGDSLISNAAVNKIF